MAERVCFEKYVTVTNNDSVQVHTYLSFQHEENLRGLNQSFGYKPCAIWQLVQIVTLHFGRDARFRIAPQVAGMTDMKAHSSQLIRQKASAFGEMKVCPNDRYGGAKQPLNALISSVGLSQLRTFTQTVVTLA